MEGTNRISRTQTAHTQMSMGLTHLSPFKNRSQNRSKISEKRADFDARNGHCTKMVRALREILNGSRVIAPDILRSDASICEGARKLYQFVEQFRLFSTQRNIVRSPRRNKVAQLRISVRKRDKRSAQRRCSVLRQGSLFFAVQ